MGASTGQPVRTDLWAEALARVRVIILAGVPTGVVVAGLGSRLAMLVLRLTSPRSVRGIKSDDGFVIGRLTLGGTYNLALLGAVVGVIGAVTYRCVRRWLVGPWWFRRATVGLAAGAVVGSMLVHDDGIDFHALEPTWLAVGSFVVLPALFAVAVAVAVDRIEVRATPARRPLLAPLLWCLAFPFVLVLVVPVALGAVVQAARPAHGGVPPDTVATWLVRAAWLTVAMWGLVVLVRDVRAVTG